MSNNHKSGPRRLASSNEISNLVRAYGITRDQARRLISKFKNDRAKLGKAARVLKARLTAPQEIAFNPREIGRNPSAEYGDCSSLGLQHPPCQPGSDKQIFGEE